ncbi:MAG: hypothetical protein VKL39_23710 [Leptolyngbyaceae bacterium]|nr:hypothetical protein [Leptolyngbyaceae bacterium]
MDNLVILHPKDFLVYREFYKDLSDKCAVFHSPELYEAFSRFFPDSIYIAPFPSIDGYDVERRALALSVHVDSLIEEVFSLVTTGWLWHDLWFLVSNITNHSSAANAIFREIGERTIIYNCPTQPYEFGVHSFIGPISAGSVIKNLQGRVNLLNSGGHDVIYPKFHMEELSKTIGSSDYSLVNLGTCFYDKELFENNIKRSFPNPIYMPFGKYDPPHVNIPSAPKSDIDFDYLSDLSDSVVELSYRIRGLIANLLPFEPYLDTQSEKFATLIAYKYKFYKDLESLILRKGPPFAVALSNHESGYTAPMHSICRSYNIPTYIFPHAKFNNLRLSTRHRANLHVLGHPLGRPAKDYDGIYIQTDYSLFAVDFDAHPGISKSMRVGVLCSSNGMDGVSDFDYSRLCDKLLALSISLERIGVTLVFRHRRASSFALLLARLSSDRFASSVDESSLDSFLRSVDFACSLDFPTSAAVDSINLGKPVFHLVTSDLKCPINDEMYDPCVIPFVSVQSAPSFITALYDVPWLGDAFAADQRRRLKEKTSNRT